MANRRYIEIEMKSSEVKVDVLPNISTLPTTWMMSQPVNHVTVTNQIQIIGTSYSLYGSLHMKRILKIFQNVQYYLL